MVEQCRTIRWRSSWPDFKLTHYRRFNQKLFSVLLCLCASVAHSFPFAIVPALPDLFTQTPAGAVVPPGLQVPDRTVVMGVPGKIVRPVKDDDLEYMKWINPHYIKLAEKYARGEFPSL